MYSGFQDLADMAVANARCFLGWVFLTEDGRGMIERRTEYATDVLKKARDEGKLYYAAPLFRFFSSPRLVAIDPSTLSAESIQQLSSGTEDPLARKPFDNFKNMLELDNDSILSWVFKQDKQAYEERKLLADLMRMYPKQSDKLKHIVNRKLKEQLDVLRNLPDDFCLYQWVHQFSMEVVAEHVLGLKNLPANAHAILDKAEIAIVRETEPFHILGFNINVTSSQRQYSSAKEAFLKFANEMVDNNETDILKNPGYLNSVLNKISSDLKIVPSEAIKHHEVRKILACSAAGLLFAAGTLSTSLAMGLLHLNDYKNWENDEEDLDEDPNANAEAQCLGALYKESLRYTSSAAHNLRYASKEKKLKTKNGEAITIHAGSYIVIDHRSSHQSKETWSEPEKFNPARFLVDDAPQINTSSFSPVSLGLRMCPGRQVAEVIFKAVIVFMCENHINLIALDPAIKDIFNETYWTSRDFVTRLRAGKKIAVDAIAFEQNFKRGFDKVISL